MAAVYRCPGGLFHGGPDLGCGGRGNTSISLKWPDMRGKRKTGSDPGRRQAPDHCSSGRDRVYFGSLLLTPLT